MLYGVRSNDISILTHGHTPAAEQNGFRQAGNKVPVTARKKLPTVINTTKVVSAPPPFSRPAALAALRANKGRLVSSTVTALRNPSATNWQNDLLDTSFDKSPLSTWINPYKGKVSMEAPRAEGSDMDGSLLGKSGLSGLMSGLMDIIIPKAKIPVNLTTPARYAPNRPGPGSVPHYLGNDMSNVPDMRNRASTAVRRMGLGDDATTTTDPREFILFNSLERPLDQAGTYKEGQAVDILYRMRALQDAWNAGLVTYPQIQPTLYELANELPYVIGRIAAGGSKAAGVVNGILGAAMQEGFLTDQPGNKWRPLNPPLPPIRVTISFPKPNKSKNLIKQAIDIGSKATAAAVTGGLTLIGKSGVAGKDAKELAKKAETVIAGGTGGAVTGFVASGLNPVGFVAGAAAGGAKGLVDATKAGGPSPDVSNTFLQGALYGGAAGLVTGAGSYIAAHPVLTASVAAPAAAKAAGVGGAKVVASSAVPELTAGLVAPPMSTAVPDLLPGQTIEGVVDTTGYEPGQTTLYDTATGAVKGTIKSGINQALTDPLGFAKSKAAQLKNLKGKVDAAQGLISPVQQPAYTESPTTVLDTAKANMVPLLAGGALLLFVVTRRTRK